MSSVSVVTTETLSPRRNGERQATEVINIKNSGRALGIKIIGGKSSIGTAEFGIFVKKILAGGVAELDGRLREGDQILQANSESTLGVTNDKALSILRSASQSQNIKILINRDSQTREEFSQLMSMINGSQAFPSSGFSSLTNGTASLTRNGSFGSSRASTPSPTMGKRSWVMSGGRMSPLALGRHGNLSPANSFDQGAAGMQRMYSVDLPTLPVGPTVAQQPPGAQGLPSYRSSVQMQGVGNSRTNHMTHTNGDISGDLSSSYARPSRQEPHYSPPLAADAVNGTDSPSPDDTVHLMAERHSICSEATADSGLATDRHSASSSPTFDHPGELQVIVVVQNHGLGLCIVGGTNRPEGPLVYIDDLIEGGDARKDGRLKRGDQLVKVNGETLVGVTHEQAKSLLTRLKLRRDVTHIEITFIRGGHRPNSQASLHNGGSPRNSANDQLRTKALLHDGNGVERAYSRPSSAGSQPDLSNTDIFMQQLLAASSSSSVGINSTGSIPTTHFVASPESPQSQGSATAMNFVSSHGSPLLLGSPAAISSPVPVGTQPVMNQIQDYTSNSLLASGPSQPIGAPYPGHVAPAVPQRMMGGFQPAMSSTPTAGISNGVEPSLVYAGQPGAVLMNGAAPVIYTGNQIQPPQFTSSPFEISPVGPPLQTTFEPSSVPYYLQQDLEVLRRISQNTTTPLSQQSSPNSISGQQSVVVPQSSSSRGVNRVQRNARNNRRLSLDPHTRLKVEKLEVALRYLGFEPTEEQQRELRSKLRVDTTGAVSYGDFVHLAREVFALQLAERPLHNSAFQFAIQDANAAGRESFVQMQQQSQQIASLEATAKQNAEDVDKIKRERDEALREVAHLRKILKQKEEECFTTEEEVTRSRRDAQGLLERSRSLENRVHLASQAQEAAKSMEQDYEEVIRLLETELDAYKAKAAEVKPNPKEFEELQQRLIVLGCQLRKAEVGRRTYEVATEKLIQFAELVHVVMTEGATAVPQKKPGKGESVRRDGGARPPAYLSRNAKQNPQNLAKEATETVKSIKALLEEEPLPFGWEEAYTPDGVRYYINHVTQGTSWLHPVTRVQHLPTIAENGHGPQASEDENT